jgi:hypothetical protein
MRNSPIILWLCGFPPLCLAQSQLAGHFEAVLYYYTYKLEFLTQTDPKQRVIATGCKGTGEGGMCKFDEFLKHIISSQHKSQYLTGPSNPLASTESPNEIIADEQRTIFGYKGSIEYEVFHSGLKNPKTPQGDVWTQPDLMKKIEDSLRDSVQRAKNTISKFNEIEPDFNKVKTYAKAIYEGRRIENGEGMVKAIQAEYPNKKYRGFKVAPLRENGNVVGVDTDLTVANNKGRPGPPATEFRDFVVDFHMQKQKGRSADNRNTAIRKQRIIEAVKSLDTMLQKC